MEGYRSQEVMSANQSCSRGRPTLSRPSSHLTLPFFLSSISSFLFHITSSPPLTHLPPPDGRMFRLFSTTDKKAVCSQLIDLLLSFLSLLSSSPRSVSSERVQRILILPVTTEARYRVRCEDSGFLQVRCRFTFGE